MAEKPTLDELGRALYEAAGSAPGWDHDVVSEATRDYYRELADAVLEAAGVPALLERVEALERERDELEQALSEDPSRWSFNVLMFIGRRLLEEVYPADIFTGATDASDPGVKLVVALRECQAALSQAQEPTP